MCGIIAGIVKPRLTIGTQGDPKGPLARALFVGGAAAVIEDLRVL
jgi:hypothetical protein